MKVFYTDSWPLPLAIRLLKQGTPRHCNSLGMTCWEKEKAEAYCQLYKVLVSKQRDFTVLKTCQRQTGAQTKMGQCVCVCVGHAFTKTI